MTRTKVAVAISIYKSDTVKNIKLSLDSIKDQTYTNFHAFVQVDGEVSDDVTRLLESYKLDYRFTVIYNDENLGLAKRLNDSIELAILDKDFKYIARMDADDICELDRFEKQVNFLESNLSIDVLGSDVWEISSSGKKIFYKSMSHAHTDLVKNIIKKCPFNHPSVMIRASVFEEGFRYKSELMNTQDYYLWVDLLAADKIFANINEPLLNFRVDDDFYHRRGLKKAMNDLNARLYAFKKLGNLSVSSVVYTIALFLLRVSPPLVKKFAYNKLR